MEEGVDYQIIGTLGGTPVIDADLLLFDTNPDQYGDPVLLFSCIQPTGDLEAVTFQAPSSGTFYLVIRWVGGGYHGTCEVSFNRFISLEAPYESSILRSGTLIDIRIEDTYLSTTVFNWDNSDNQTFNSPYDTTLPNGDGEHILYVYAQDPSGAWGFESYMFITDDNSPIITLELPTNGSVLHSNSLINISITDPQLDIVIFNWDGVNNQTFDSPYDAYLPNGDGEHILWIFANDTLDNSRSVYYYFITDDSAPTYSNLEQSTSEPEYNEINTVSITVSEPSDASGIDTILLFYRLDSGTWTYVDVT
jgi:hypothetical protein